MERLWGISELKSDNISKCEQDPESDAKLVRFKLRVSWLRQTPRRVLEIILQLCNS